MALRANNSAPSNTKSFDPVESGNYLARVVRVIDLGLQTQRPYKGQEKPPVNQISVTYELVTEFLKDEDGNDMEDKPRFVSETLSLYPLSNEKAKSTQRMTGIDPSGELDGDWGQATGRACTVTIVQNVSKSNGKTYANVGSVTPAMKGIEVPPLVNPEMVFDLESPDLDVFNQLPEWLQGVIKDNLEFNGSPLQAALNGTTPAPAPAPEPGVEDDEEESPF